MPIPTVSLLAPAANHSFPDPGILRPGSRVSWTGGTGPFDVVFEWDTDAGFSAPIQVTLNGVTSPQAAVPTSDLGPVGTTWYARARVVDTSDAAFANTASAVLTWFDPVMLDRTLQLLANVGVAFDPTDTPVGGWGPAAGSGPGDGYPIDTERTLYLISNVGVSFDPTDTPVGGWGPAAGSGPADGYTIDFLRALYLLSNVGVGFDPTDTPVSGWGAAGSPGDLLTRDRDRFLYLLAGDVSDNTPTPHIWYLFPTFGRVGWEFRIVGYGFGDTEATYLGTAALNGINLGVVSWVLVAAIGTGMEIDPDADIANPIHQLIRVIVPPGATSGTVIVTTNGP